MSSSKVKISQERLDALWSEIKMAEKYNEEELKPIGVESIERYTGVHVPHIGMHWDIILNEVYPIVQHNLPATFFRTPRAFLKPRNKTYIAKRRDPVGGGTEEVQIDSSKSAKTQESIVNYQLVEIKYKGETRKVLLDSLLFPHGVLWHGYKGDFGMTEEHSIFVKKDKVFVQRISPMRFIKDPAVTFENLNEGEWVGRILDVRLRDIKEDDRLDVSKELKGFNGFGTKVGLSTAIDQIRKVGGIFNGRDVVDINRTDLIDFADENFKRSSASKFIRVYEIFLRPSRKEAREGSKGWILLLTQEQTKPLRVSNWRIKAEGFPAKLLAFNNVPDRMMGIADVQTYSQIADQKNTITNLQIRNAQENTKVWVGINKGGTDEEDIQKVQQGQNTIVLFEGDNPVGQRMFVASPGGQASNELYLIDQRIQRNLEDKSGVSDLKRGFLQSGEESATSVKIRSAGASARPMYRQDIMTDFLRDSVHYLVQLNKQFVPFKEAVRIIGSLDLEWSDDPSEEEIQADVDVEIDVISMLPENPEEELRRLNETLALAIQGITIPEVRRKLQEEGKTINISPLLEQILIRQRIRNPEIFRNIKPEESQGFVSVAEIRAAQANVEAALQGSDQIPSPPQEGQDHVARIEVYSTIMQTIKELGDTLASQIMTQLIEIHQALLQAEQQKQPQAGQSIKLPKGGVRTV
jgi:hypothetical protein